MLFQAARHGAEPLASAEDDEDDEAATPKARAGGAGRWRNIISGLVLVCVAVTGSVVISGSLALRARGLVSGGTVAASDVLEHKIAAVVVDSARAGRARRRMSSPGLGADWGSGDAGDFSTVEPQTVIWNVDVRKETPYILESQKFRLLKHMDGEITLRDLKGLHLITEEGSAPKMKGGVTTQGVLVATPIGERGKFTFVYNFDSTVSLRQSNKSCLALTKGGLAMKDCDKNDGAETTFTPVVLESEGVVAFKTKARGYLTVQEEWVRDYKTSLVMVSEKVAENSPYKCAKFHRGEEEDGRISLMTLRASYLTAAGGGALNADAVEVGPEQMFTTVRSDDGGVSLRAPAARRQSAGSSPGFLEEQKDGTVRATGVAGSDRAIALQQNSDGTVSLTRNGRYVCVAARPVTVATCETRGHGSKDDAWPMQGVNKSMTVRNVCAGNQWYGFKTKVDAYQKFAEQLANESHDLDQILILVDNSDVAFGGCSYEELLYRYDLIHRLTNATVIAGADNSPYPTSDWPYDSLQDKRQVIMEGFGMSTDQFCEVTDCPDYEYKYPNSGFLMGPASVLHKLLGCMRDGGYGDFGKTGFDDQQGLQVCMFGDFNNTVALDYSGTLTMELIRMKNTTLYEGNGKVYNRVARGMSQCFVHGNGDTLKTWWPMLFPGSTDKEDYGKNFMT